eukprot:7390522-Prymnesium_polylepis.1
MGSIQALRDALALTQRLDGAHAAGDDGSVVLLNGRGERVHRARPRLGQPRAQPPEARIPTDDGDYVNDDCLVCELCSLYRRGAKAKGYLLGELVLEHLERRAEARRRRRNLLSREEVDPLERRAPVAGLVGAERALQPQVARPLDDGRSELGGLLDARHDVRRLPALAHRRHQPLRLDLQDARHRRA